MCKSAYSAVSGWVLKFNRLMLKSLTMVITALQSCLSVLIDFRIALWTSVALDRLARGAVLGL